MHFDTLVVLTDPSLDSPAKALAALQEALGEFTPDNVQTFLQEVDDPTPAADYFREHPEECGPGRSGPEHTWDDVEAGPQATHQWTIEAVGAFHANSREDGYCEDGTFGYQDRYNPNTRLDGWSLGGRFAGKFIVRPEAAVGAPDDPISQFLRKASGAPTPPAPAGPVHAYINGRPRPCLTVDSDRLADLARREDVDLTALKDEAAHAAHALYDNLDRVAGALPMPRDWNTTHASLPDGATHNDVQDALNMQPWVSAVRAARLADYIADPVSEFRVNAGGREAYVAHQVRAVVTPSAVLIDGTWSDEDDDDFPADFLRWFDELPPHAWIAYTDCHI